MILDVEALFVRKIDSNKQALESWQQAGLLLLLHHLENLTKSDMWPFPDFKHHFLLIPDAVLPKPCKLRIILHRWDKMDEMDEIENQGGSRSCCQRHGHGWQTSWQCEDHNWPVATQESNRPFPLSTAPNIRDLYTKLRRAKYFSKLDLRKDCFNTDLDEDSSLLTTTITLKELFAYKKLPLGLKDSDAVFKTWSIKRWVTSQAASRTSTILSFLQTPEKITTRRFSKSSNVCTTRICGWISTNAR